MPAPQTVLIVEDDEAISDSIAYALDRAGFRTLRAGDGGQGLRLFRQQRPDLVILDLMLPQVDGWRVTEEMRREDPRVPVIVCSARTSEFDRVHGLEMGADDYVTKPFSMKELLARVNAHLRRVESHRQPDAAQTIEVGPLSLAIVVDGITRDEDGRPRYHYTIIDFAAEWLHGEAVAADDVSEVAWVHPDDFAPYDLTPETHRAVAAARDALARR